jgi:hypothetical protein
MEQSFREADSASPSSEINLLIWNPTVYYSVADAMCMTKRKC